MRLPVGGDPVGDRDPVGDPPFEVRSAVAFAAQHAVIQAGFGEEEAREEGAHPLAAHQKPPWWAHVAGLYDVVADPRELTDLQHVHPDVVRELQKRLHFWNATTVPSVHLPEDPEGKVHANATHCWGPWR